MIPVVVRHVPPLRLLSVRPRPVPPPVPPPPQEGGPPTQPPRDQKPSRRDWLLLVGVLGVFLLITRVAVTGAAPDSWSYSELRTRVAGGEVATMSIDDGGAVHGTLKNGSSFTSRLPTALAPLDLDQELEARGVSVTATKSGGSPWVAALLGWLPLLVLLGLLLWSGRLAQRSFAGGLGAIGRSKAKVTDAERPQTRFADVAGYDGVKQEVTEVVDVLRHPDRYRAAGAKAPRGVLMVGPPGTGKTLLARAVAGEADVPFLSVTGSAFVEMFVGVGAARVRDLFADARRRAPAILFIDEIDAIGGHRSRGAVLSNDEREQTLNQLLAEMDGFDQNTDIVVLAATNRPEALDPALLRPGRFDRQVVVPLPNQAERAAILLVHAHSRHLAEDVDLSRVARGTPGFSGADLANLVNEAAINAVRDGRTTVTADDLDVARDRVLLGRRDTSNALLPDERHAVAVHESGHAVVAALCPHADPVDRVTILPSGVALGVTEQLPEVERHLYSESFLEDLLAVRLGGRAAELTVLGEASSGAANDLADATAIATRMVVELGLSPRLGPVGYADNALSRGDSSGRPFRGYAEQTQLLVDQEVARLLREAEQRALRLLSAHRPALDALVGQLLEHETVDGPAVTAALRAVATPEPRQPSAAAATVGQLGT